MVAHDWGYSYRDSTYPSALNLFVGEYGGLACFRSSKCMTPAGGSFNEPSNPNTVSTHLLCWSPILTVTALHRLHHYEYSP